jgi:hypothetical protein
MAPLQGTTKNDIARAPVGPCLPRATIAMGPCVMIAVTDCSIVLRHCPQVLQLLAMLLPSWQLLRSRRESHGVVLDLLIFCEGASCQELPPECRPMRDAGERAGCKTEANLQGTAVSRSRAACFWRNRTLKRHAVCAMFRAQVA